LVAKTPKVLFCNYRFNHSLFFNLGTPFKMRKYFLISFTVLCTLVLISWGPAGHRAIAKIAENHLSPTAKQAVKNILGTESLADVSNYADEIRSNPEYRYTGIWHYANVPAGYNYEQFSTAIKTMRQDNVYKMVLKFEADLKDPDLSRSKKAAALKFLVHLVGDLHQPMHAGHAEDKGGNEIRVTFNGYDDNLHGLWDSGLIEHQGLTYKHMAESYDNATPIEIKKWQSDDPMIWLWESYQISTILYKEAAENPNFGEEYYKTHLPVLQKRIEKAGIRLAGILNAIFDKPGNSKAPSQ
jgi:hypothetical protein